MIHHEKTDITIKGPVREVAGAVVVHDARDFVGKCAKAEDVGDGVVIDIVDKVVAWIDGVGIVVVIVDVECVGVGQ